MQANSGEAIDSIHRFWFGELDSHGRSAADRQILWFRKSDATDQKIATQFGALLKRARAAQLDDWAESDRGLVALIVLLDQFSRNIFRGSAEAFAADDKALGLATDAIDAGRHHHLPVIHRVFLFLPLEHCEDIAVQERCVALFEELGESGEEDLQNFTQYALAHRDVIARFGRFPHRNALLGRESSAEEMEYLRTNGGF
ncbi:DUF924 family protein [Gymnodinialimonas sp.]